MVPWLDGYAGFPPTNFVCDNTKSTDYGECIIGHLGCEHTTTKDRELPPPVLDIDYDYTEHGMLRYRHKCANGCGASIMCVSTTDAEDQDVGWETIFDDKGKKDFCPQCKDLVH